MMPLKDKQNDGKVNQVSGALSTEEIVSLLSKSNKDFIKESDISSNIKNLFTKVTPKLLAQKNKSQKNELDKKTLENKDPSFVEQKIDSQNNEKKIDEKPLELEKKYTEQEAKKLANEYAKQYYNNGYRLGVKKTNEELQKGDKALAVTLKNTADNLFKLTPNFIEELNNSVTNLLSNLCKEILGYEIDSKNKFFQDKILNLTKSVENSIKKVEIFLNPKDLSAITNFNSKNNLDISLKMTSDEKLERGDVKIKSGSIEISDIVSNKIKFSMPSEIESELQNLKVESTNQEDKVNN